MYADADADVLRLDLNTNLFGENPVRDRLADGDVALTRYPSERSDPLRRALAERWDRPPDRFVVGNGADGVLDFAFRALTEPGGRLVVPVPAFPMYRFFADLRRLRIRSVPLRDDLSLPVSQLATSDGDVLVLANPYNPTGEHLDRGTVLDLVGDFPGVVVVDEAYIDFAEGESVLPDAEDHEDLVVVHTLSKAHGLAGLRVGYAAAGPRRAEEIADARPPFFVGTVSEALAAASVRDGTFARSTAKRVREQRPGLADRLVDHGFDPLPSQANFVLAESPADPFDVHEALAERDVLVRVFPDEPLLEDHLRVTVGPPETVDRLDEALAEVLP